MPPKIALTFISCTLFLSFIFFSYLVSKELFTQFDFDTTVKFQDRLPRSLDLLFSMLSILGSIEITGLAWFGLMVFSLLKRFWLTFISLPLFIAAHALELFGKLYLYHPAPPVFLFRGVLDNTLPKFYVHTEYSYPSGHMMRTAFLVSFLLIFLQLKTKGIRKVIIQLGLVTFLLIMTVSRIYLGEHWATDVVGGALLGGSLGILTSVTVPLRSSLKNTISKLQNTTPSAY